MAAQAQRAAPTEAVQWRRMGALVKTGAKCSTEYACRRRAPRGARAQRTSWPQCSLHLLLLGSCVGCEQHLARSAEYAVDAQCHESDGSALQCIGGCGGRHQAGQNTPAPRAVAELRNQHGGI